MNASATMKHLDGPTLGDRVTLGLVQMQADSTKSFFMLRALLVYLIPFSGLQNTSPWMGDRCAGEGSFVLQDIILMSYYGKLIQHNKMSQCCQLS